MSSLKESSQHKRQEEDIEVRDFESLLQKSLNNDQLRVIDFKATKLLPLGENYCSLMVKIDVTVIKDENLVEENFNFVAKMMSKSESCFINWADVFKKEVFMYDELLPAYRDLEREAGIDEGELIDLLPKFIGFRNSVDKNGDGLIDDDSLLLMENIKAKGYDSGSRRFGMNADQAREALKSLARYHALGIALKDKEPQFFKKAKSQGEIISGDFSLYIEGLERILKDIREEFNSHKHLNSIESIFENTFNWLKSMNGNVKLTPEEPWATITHGDFHINNIMFHKDANGKIDDVKFVDFQTYLYFSPLKDIPYFFCASLDDDAVNNHFDELLDIYYETFIKTLSRMSCDIKPFTRSAFECELKKQALNEFPVCAFVTKFIAFELRSNQDESKLVNNILNSEVSDLCRKKLLQLIDIYDKKNWFVT